MDTTHEIAIVWLCISTALATMFAMCIFSAAWHGEEIRYRRFLVIVATAVEQSRNEASAPRKMSRHHEMQGVLGTKFRTV